MNSKKEKTLNWVYGLWFLLNAILVFILIRHTFFQGQDFEVFWRAGLNLRKGLPLYPLTNEDPMVFKYPPWFAPFFIPFSLLSLGSAKIIWGLIQGLSLLGIQSVLYSWGVSRGVLLISLLVFWGIWMVHGLDGQVNLPLLYVLLFTWNHRSDALMLFALPMKVATLLPIWTCLLYTSPSPRD